MADLFKDSNPLFKSSSNAIYKKNAEQQDKIYKELLNKHLKDEQEFEEKRKDLIKKYEEEEVKAAASGHKKKQSIAHNELVRLRAEQKKFEDDKKQYAKKAAEDAARFEEIRYKGLTARQKLDYQKDIKEKLTAKKSALNEELKYELFVLQELQEKQKSFSEGSKEWSDINTQIQSQQTIVHDKQTDFQDANSALQQTEAIVSGLFNSVATHTEKLKKLSEDYSQAEDARREAFVQVASAERILDDAIKSGDEIKIQAAKKAKESAEEYAEAKTIEANAALNAKNSAEQLSESYESLEQKQEELKKKQEDLEKKREQGLHDAVNKVSNGIEKRLEELYSQQGRMIARLQGSDSDLMDWSKAVYEVSSKVGFSPTVSQTAVVKKMTELIDSGVAYNVELRAFLAETSENIASTFDAFDSNLLRLIRLQQADTTSARLGMEASLTKLFNDYFKDTSYLNKGGPSDSVTGALMEAFSTMNKNDSLAFEYAVQKWLGSLYSLGMSSDAVSKVASGINYLATGNVSALGNDTALQTLFAMSAAKAGGKSYADMLTGGITASDTNKLLKAMIEYLADIAESQENYVTKSAYAQLFGMSISDLSTFTSLTSEEIDNIYNKNENYESLNQEVQNQLDESWKRLNIVQIVNNIMDNAFTGAAQMIGSNAVTYGLWKALNLVQGLAEFEIPGIQAMGTGTASGLKVFEIAKLGMGGAGLLASLLAAIGSATNPDIDSFLDKWKFQEYTPRGSTLSIMKSGSSSGTSLSAMMGTGSSSAEDVEAASLASAHKSGTDALDRIQSEEFEEVANMEQKIYEAVADESGNTVLKTLMQMCGALGAEQPSEGEQSSSSNNSGISTDSSSSSSDGVSTSSGSSSEMYNKIYEAISSGETVNVLTVLQEINDKLNQDRVFYTSMSTLSSGPSNVAGSITDISAQLQANKVPIVPEINADNNLTNMPTDKKPSGTGMSGLFSSETYSEDLQLIISTAVETALRSIAGYSNGNGLPVVVTNLNNYGG